MQTIWILGAGGIGSALAELFVTKGHDVIVLSRAQPKACHGVYYSLDCTNSDAVDQWVAAQNQTPDMIINTIGYLHDDQHRPEKSLRALSSDHLHTSIAVNTLPTAYMAQALEKHVMTAATNLLFVCLSARVGSISDNRYGGWYSYRMSKAALNMLIKNIGIEWQRQYPSVGIFGYQPGTVS